MFFKYFPLFLETFDDKFGRRKFNVEVFGYQAQSFCLKNHSVDKLEPSLNEMGVTS